jgi:hypothetical protein
VLVEKILPYELRQNKRMQYQFKEKDRASAETKKWWEKFDFLKELFEFSVSLKMAILWVFISKTGGRYYRDM